MKGSWIVVVLLISLIFLGVIFWIDFNTQKPIKLAEAIQNQLALVDGERVMVAKVIDGDTLITEQGSTVRFLGVDTPETLDPRRPVGCFGKEASNKVKELLSGQTVILQKDISDKDKYDRLLRYIYLPLEDGQTLFINDYLIREGYALALNYPPDSKYDIRFRDAETAAKMQGLGLWGKCN